MYGRSLFRQRRRESLSAGKADGCAVAGGGRGRVVAIASQVVVYEADLTIVPFARVGRMGRSELPQVGS